MTPNSTHEARRVSRIAGMWCLLAAASAYASDNEPARIYPLPNPETFLIGALETRVLRYEDTLNAVARTTGVGFEALQRANPQVDAWLPGEGTEAVLPTAFLLPDAPRDGIVINLSERRLYYFDHVRSRLIVYPVGIGTKEWPTPTMRTRTVARIENPSWTPPASVRREHLERGEELPRVVPPGPDNPLGSYAIQLAAPGLFIHGTNRLMGVGQPVSHGCIRLYEGHIKELGTTVANGTTVLVVRQNHKVGWHDGSLYLESHPDDTQPASQDFTDVVRAIVKLTDEQQVSGVDWTRALAVARAASGLPENISIR